ncbi:unnamed protein product [Prunus armeniaca]|uniref:NB-ARC domain-containing protein n=1 Tax=Prunus armeniaca TaxID=36596 RepID=A0A6J5XMJ5_PRUAR|nr:unnamed protein product [Prunus armeniaca]
MGGKCFLVIDDVDQLNQLQILAGKKDWFGLGSRIIITTRKEPLLIEHNIEERHQLLGLQDNEDFHPYDGNENHPLMKFTKLENHASHISCYMKLRHSPCVVCEKVIRSNSMVVLIISFWYIISGHKDPVLLMRRTELLNVAAVKDYSQGTPDIIFLMMAGHYVWSAVIRPLKKLMTAKPFSFKYKIFFI